jgi:chromosome segregation ATPase
MTNQNDGTPGPWSVRKCGCGSPYCHIYYTSNGTFYEGSGYSLADATRIARVPEMESRIAELEAVVARLRAESKQLGRLWEANQELLAESKEIGFQFDEVTRLTAENERLREVLKECADDLETYVNQEYTIEQRGKYPNMDAKYARDMEPVAKARAALNTGKERRPHDRLQHGCRNSAHPPGI